MGDIITLPLPQRRPLPRRAMPGIVKRLALIGEALELQPDEIIRAARDLDALIDFAWRHGQSMDWICLGDPVNMIRRCATSGW